jgi:Na+/glutamate symporter
MLISENAKVTITLGLVVSLVIGIAVASFAVGRKVMSFDSRLAIVEEKSLEHDAIRARLNNQDITLAEIRTDLKWIRTNLESKTK